jgi:hypothetical protein
MTLPRFVVGVLSVTAIFLVPWTLWLTFSLPSKHVTHHYDVAWVGFDVGLLCAFALTAWAAYRRPQLLVPFAAGTCTLLLCDARFDVVTSSPGERAEAATEAGLAELPLALLCAFVVVRRLRRR